MAKPSRCACWRHTPLFLFPLSHIQISGKPKTDIIPRILRKLYPLRQLYVTSIRAKTIYSINPFISIEEDEFLAQAAKIMELEYHGEFTNIIRLFRGRNLPHSDSV